VYTDEAIKLLNEKFSCFAPGWYINSKDDVYQAAWKRFYVAKPDPSEGKGWLQGTQLVMMTSAGRLLSGSMKYGDRNSLAQALREVLDAYAKLPEDQRRPKAVEGEEKPVPAPPAGGLVLTIYDRPLGRGDEGGYRLPEGDDFDGFRTHAPHGQRSSLWLTEDEWKSLVPSDPKPGQTQAVPTKLAKRIWLYGLVPQTLWVVEEFWKPDSVREGELHVTVEEVTSQVVRMRMHGSVLLSGPGVLHEWPNRKFIKNVENRYDARLEGVLVYDQTQQKIARFDIAALGDYSGRWFAGNKGWKEATRDAPLPLGFAFEVDKSAYELPAERRRPRSFVHAYIFNGKEQFYWDPEKWEEDWKKRRPR
jgi:hypothetical protein